jgi:hypothetical protein
VWRVWNDSFSGAGMRAWRTGENGGGSAVVGVVGVGVAVVVARMLVEIVVFSFGPDDLHVC